MNEQGSSFFKRGANPQQGSKHPVRRGAALPFAQDMVFEPGRSSLGAPRRGWWREEVVLVVMVVVVMVLMIVVKLLQCIAAERREEGGG